MKTITSLILASLFSGAALGQSPTPIIGKRAHLSNEINTKDLTDSGPVLSHDGNTMYFKRYAKNAGYDYDIFFSKKVNGKWNEAQPLTELNNDKISDVEYVFPDGKTMLVTGTFNDKSGIFKAHYNGSTWGDLELVDIKKKLDANSDNIGVAISSKQDVMVISIGGDLYFTSFKNGEWSEAREITDLNTHGYEYTPFLDYDDKTLYIAGTGYGGGNANADIWVVKRKDDTWMNWSDPVKAEGDINSSEWESFFYISPDRKNVFVYSRAEGDGDIYEIKRDEEQLVVNDEQNSDNTPQLLVVNVPEPEEVVTDIIIPESVSELPPTRCCRPIISCGIVNTITEGLNNDQETLAVIDSEAEEPESSIQRVPVLENESVAMIVYPNPTKNEVFVRTGKKEDKSVVSVFVMDVNLRLVTELKSTDADIMINLSEYGNGIYFVKAVWEGKSETKEIIVEK